MALALFVTLAAAYYLARPPRSTSLVIAEFGSGTYALCSWNVENLFDDVDDPADHDRDEDWFGQHPEYLSEKLAHLADALLLQEGGRGPDILAIVEVENRRAAELLQNALNSRLSPDAQYRTLLFHENRTGRHIAPAILARLPGVIASELRFSDTLRILPARFTVNGAALTILVSHWTSRVTDKTGRRRAIYADALFRAVRDQGADADVLICGDFNDEPTDPAVRDHLHAVGAQEYAQNVGSMLLRNLLAEAAANGEGTIVYRGQFQMFDELVANRGLLDPTGWSVLPETARVVAPGLVRAGRDGHPFRFGGPTERGPRGYSDHFAVAVQLRVGG